MKVVPTQISEVLILEPRVFTDERGLFFESWNARAFREAVGADITFVQDNHSRSIRGVLRGLHYQIGHPQGKLIRVVRGTAFDVAVDLRKSSPTFGKWVGVELDDRDQKQIWIPPGFAHGFLVLSAEADVLYKVTDYYAPRDEYCLAWNDPQVGIDWHLDVAPIMSAKDQAGALLRDAQVFP